MLLDDIADLLTTGAISTTIYKGYMPEQPDDAFSVVETGGLGAVHAMSTGPGNALLEVPGFQLVRRSSSYQTARSGMQDAFDLLDGLSERTINSTRYSYVVAQQSPFSLGRDESQRSRIVLNFLAYKTLS
jgi:hypothetical protein